MYGIGVLTVLHRYIKSVTNLGTKPRNWNWFFDTAYLKDMSEDVIINFDREKLHNTHLKDQTGYGRITLRWILGG
jgi:hypothetical protein